MLKLVSLFTGVGGLDFGFEAAGFTTVAAVEFDRTACNTIRMNRPWPVLEGDIHSISSQEIMEAGNLKPQEAAVLIGGPPCQPFSKSSYWAKGDALRLDDHRADTLTAYLRVLRDLQPKAFLLENVEGLIYKGKDEGLQYILAGIELVNEETGSNYSISYKKLNAADYGVPQLRERIFLVGSRDGVSFEFPNATHRPKSAELSLFEYQLPEYRNAWDAIGDLPASPKNEELHITSKWADLVPTIPEGQNYLWHTNRGGGSSIFGWRTRYWSFLLKLAKNLPSWTIQAKPGSATGPFHWNNRRLSVQEMCRLQTFPDRLIFDCGRGAAQKMLGNAVPSLLAEVLAIAIRKQLLDCSVKEDNLQLLPPLRTPLPEPRKITSLPEKYKELIGEHPDHPGGKKKKQKLMAEAVK